MVWQISRGLMTKILIWIIRSLISTIRMLPDLLLASITSQRMLSDSGPKGSSQSVSMVAWKFRSRFSMSGRVAAVPKRLWNKSSRLVGMTPSLVCGYKGNHFFMRRPIQGLIGPSQFFPRVSIHNGCVLGMDAVSTLCGENNIYRKISPNYFTSPPWHFKTYSRNIYIYLFIYLCVYLFVFIFYIHSFCQSIWHLFWHFIWHSLQLGKWTGRGQVRVRQGPLRSRACSWGPAGAILILGLLFESGRTTAISHLQLRQGPCSLIRGLLFGPAGTTAITSLQLRSGREHSDPGLVVRSSACSWGQAEKGEGEGEGGGQLT